MAIHGTEGMAKQKQVITFLPDEEYEPLYKLVKQKGRYSEVFWPDKVETKMWIQDGKLMSQMKGDLHIKQILPNSKMNEFMGGERFIGESGFSKSIQFIQERDNLPIAVASRMMLEIYRQFNIPKSVELPREILNSLKIGSIPKPNTSSVGSGGPVDNTPSPSEAQP